MKRGRFACLVFALVACVGVAAAPQAPARGRVFRSAIDVTTVNATVIGSDGRLVKGLSREAFDIYEDGRIQTVTQFTSERVPVSLGILLDVSDSMFGRRLQEARDAIERFVVDLLDREDEFSILAFNHQHHLLTKWTSDRAVASLVMQPLRPFGSTAIYDAIMASLPLAATRHRQRAALLVISDGADTASDAALRDVRFAMHRSDAFVYTVAIDTSNRQAINAQVNAGALGEITSQSGGRTLVVHDTADAISALSEIAEELNSQYLMGYTSPRGADGKYHSIHVRVRDTDYRVRARDGYVAVPRNPVPDP